MTRSDIEASPAQPQYPPPPPAYPPPAAPQQWTTDKPKWRRKRDEALTTTVNPYLGQGEEVREIFMGQSLLSPIWYLPLLLVFPVLLVLAAIKRRRTIVVTNQNVYQFSMVPLSNKEVSGILQKVQLGEAAAERGFSWSLKVGYGPRLYSTPDSGRGVREKVAALINQGNPTGQS